MQLFLHQARAKGVGVANILVSLEKQLKIRFVIFSEGNFAMYRLYEINFTAAVIFKKYKKNHQI